MTTTDMTRQTKWKAYDAARSCAQPKNHLTYWPTGNDESLPC